MRASKPFHFTLSHFGMAALEQAQHPTDLERLRSERIKQGFDAPGCDLHIDAGMMGLGGDDSWSPRTHPEHLLTQHRQGGLLPLLGGRREGYQLTVWLGVLGPHEQAHVAACSPVEP